MAMFMANENKGLLIYDNYHHVKKCHAIVVFSFREFGSSAILKKIFVLVVYC